MPSKAKRIQELVDTNTHDELVDQATDAGTTITGSKADIAAGLIEKEDTDGGTGGGGSGGDEPSQEEIDKKRAAAKPGEGNFGTQQEQNILEKKTSKDEKA